ncbi:uncharacterized protein CDV56_103391 [Aspergillus thermomutatus]|uniref:Major facilitator superfamily (MFS) profile domain-containing protein n=1 Tax=Aspergillus thermomutatus TaxID=41047 RepID=A0A397G5Y9_ASPTH|nr:uncharacterized protein CDV56_103391 [Aspergillus thermomutatus]RHZ46405.1 hypothetical protein CDV56_103391 [Aspergillus thermomutatus]
MTHAVHDDLRGGFPPGTVLLESKRNSDREFRLQPTPDDPDDPLNWSAWRKSLNFGLTCSYVLFTFVLIDINSLAYKGYMNELRLTYTTFNQASGANFAGLAFACAIWWANFHHGAELICVSLLAGLAGAISETIVVITIVDLFFVHQHARMNGIFLFMQTLGATGGPIAAGHIVISQGWRWMWWWIAIFLSVNLIAVLLFFEESKYIPTLVGQSSSSASPTTSLEKDDKITDVPEFQPVDSHLSTTAPRWKSYRQRLAFITKTDIRIKHHFYQPLFVFFSFPAVAYAAITYGCLPAFNSILASAGSYFLLAPPYNFSPSSIGLYHLGGFTGAFLAALTAPAVNDWAIVRSSRKNDCVFEPEMRLWMAIPGSLLTCTGLLMFGIGLGQGLPWIMLAVACGIFGFGFIATADVALTYLTNCYPDILSDALVAVVFVRNGISMIVKFLWTPWIMGMGIQNTFILVAMIALATMALPISLMIWGKKFRIRTAAKYKQYDCRQPAHRA